MATQLEQFVTLQLPTDFPRQWIQKGYTHLHFGAIRLALTYHGKKGLPVTARMALLDTRFMEYQHACIGTIETTLNAGTVFVTLYPNFCMSLQDPKMLTALQVQLQLNGPKQTSDSIEATLHYQMSYRVQNHALDLKVPDSFDDALLITTDYHHPTTPTCVHIPRQISRDELVKLLPERWVTNYERLNQHARPVQSTEPKFIKQKDGSVTIKFDHSHEKEPTPSIFPTMFMIQPVRSKKPEPLNKHIYGFEGTGNPIYFFRDQATRHCFWDNNECPSDCDCNYDSEEEDDRPSTIKRNKLYANSCCNYQDSDSDDDDEDFSVKIFGNVSTKEPSQHTPKYTVPKKKRPTVLPCYKPILKWQRTHNTTCGLEAATFAERKQPLPQIMMMASQDDFPPIEEYEVGNVRYAVKIPKPVGVDMEGKPLRNSTAEAVLNWQSENTMAQNRIMKKIDDNLVSVKNHLFTVETKLDSKIEISHQKTQEVLRTLQKRLDNIEKEKIVIYPGNDPEAEAEKLKRQIKMLEESTPTDKDPSVSPEFIRFEKSSSSRSQGINILLETPKGEEKADIATLRDYIRQQRKEKKRRSEIKEGKKIEKEFSRMMIRNDNSVRDTNSISSRVSQWLKTLKSEGSLGQDSRSHQWYENSNDSVVSEETLSDNTSDYTSASTIPKILMAEPAPEEFVNMPPSEEDMSTSTERIPPAPPTRSDPGINNVKFTLDDIPYSRWSQRIQEFQAWCNHKRLTIQVQELLDSLYSQSGQDISEASRKSSSVLLGFKNSFFNETSCSNPWKIMSWKVEEGKVGDCCDWGGVTCDEKDGHVIRLDLVDSCLVGWIDSESGIFDLIHLQDLNLAYNSFSQSPLPSAIGRLTRLTRLNLSSSGFVGEVVPEMIRLSNLSLPDLSGNNGMNISSVELLRSLNKIEELHLSSLTVLDGNVPRSFGNMTSLRSLSLSDCGLFGEFPSRESDKVPYAFVDELHG